MAGPGGPPFAGSRGDPVWGGVERRNRTDRGSRSSVLNVGHGRPDDRQPRLERVLGPLRAFGGHVSPEIQGEGVAALPMDPPDDQVHPVTGGIGEPGGEPARRAHRFPRAPLEGVEEAPHRLVLVGGDPGTWEREPASGRYLPVIDPSELAGRGRVEGGGRQDHQRPLLHDLPLPEPSGEPIERRVPTEIRDSSRKIHLEPDVTIRAIALPSGSTGPRERRPEEGVGGPDAGRGERGLGLSGGYHAGPSLDPKERGRRFGRDYGTARTALQRFQTPSK